MFGLSIFNRDAFFRVDLATWWITSSFDMTYTQKELPNYIAPARDATSSVGEARPPTSPLRSYFSFTPHSSLTKSAFRSVEKVLWQGGREGGRSLSTKEKRTKFEQTEILLRLFTGCCNGPGFLVFLLTPHLLHLTSPHLLLTILSTSPVKIYVTATGNNATVTAIGNYRN
jgi:hypothetical protein